MLTRLLILLCLVSTARALTVDEIVSKYIEARGGAAKLAALNSVRFTGKLLMGSDDGKMEARYGQVTARPGRIRAEVSMQGMTSVGAYDGKEAWHVHPFGGRKEADRGSADEARERAQSADIDGPLVDWKAKGHTVEYTGTEDIDGTDAHKLTVKLKDGDQVDIFLDPDSFLEIREEWTRHVRGTEHRTVADLGAYEAVGGVLFPFSIESGAKGQPRANSLTIEHADANVAVDDALFSFPGGPAAVRKIEEPAAATPAVTSPAEKTAVATVDAGALSGLEARNIGSAAMSGRVAAVAARNVAGKTTVFVGAASGGVWKSTDGGTTFRPVFDKQAVQSIGALALDPGHPSIVWAGSGEAWTRNSVSIGDGIYKSTDGGETWTNMGLPESERIARIIVHPKDGNVVFAAVPGKLWSDSTDRGLYRTGDGGKSWSLVLKGSNPSTGCASLAMDPGNPAVMFAGMWDFRRKGWTFRSGGDGPDAVSGSGLFRTADGGKTWTELTGEAAKGLPAKPWGRVEVAIAPSDAKIVYALIECKASALYRSSDGGVTWEKRDTSQGMVWRPFYFGRLVVDPKNPDKVWKPGGGLSVSDDGGRAFAGASGRSHGDWHDLWIDPDNTQHVIGGDDGGYWTSFDGGNRWWKSDNLPISQFYHVVVDDQDPYQVYGGLQDNGSWIGDTSYPGGVSSSRWECVYGGDGFWMQVDPSDPNFIYAESQGGYVGRVDRKAKTAADIQPKAQFHEKLRWNWNTPIVVSPTDGKSVYMGAQFLFRTRDRGQTWERISPDLTTNDPEKQKQEQSGGITVDNSAAEMHTTIYSISESPVDNRVIWVGTDDGNVQLTRDGGKGWTNVTGTVSGLPPASWVSCVTAGKWDVGTAYACFDRHTFGDMTPWVYRTKDEGRTWTRLVGPESGVRGYAHVIKEDPAEPSLLYLGTEFGLWISLDSGAHWAEFKGGEFPRVAVRDLAVAAREGDLVIGTHGRGIWIVDDLAPLRALARQVPAGEAAFLSVRPVQQRMGGTGGWVLGDNAFVGENPPGGAPIVYWLRQRHLMGPIALEVVDAAGHVVDTLSATKRRGVNRVVWSMQVKPPKVPRAASMAYAGSQGPRIVPGTYTVRLTRGKSVVEAPLAVVLDRRAPYTVADRKAQFDAAMRVHALFGRESELTERMEALRDAAVERARGLPEADPLRKRLDEFVGKLEELRKKVVATKEGGAITGEERIREHTDLLYMALLSWEGKPPETLLERTDALVRETDDVAKGLGELVAGDGAALDGELKGHNLPPLTSPSITR